MAKILFITTSPPWPPTTGDQQRSHLLYHALARCGTVHTLLYLEPWRIFAEQDRALRERYGLVGIVPQTSRGSMGNWRYVRRIWPKGVDRLATAVGSRAADYDPDPSAALQVGDLIKGGGYDLIVGRCLKYTAGSGALGHHPLVIDVDDVDYQSWECRSGNAVGMVSRMLYRRQARQMREVVPERLRQADHLWLVSPADMPLVEHPSRSLVPNIALPAAGGVAIQPLEPNDTSRTILTVGTLWQRMNRDGVDYFLSKIWPLVLQACPDAGFVIAGGGASARDTRRWKTHRNVKCLGFVSNLREQYASCAFTVAPQIYGGGTKIKVLDSLAHGRTCVTTPQAHRGYETTLKQGESVLVADDPRRFADACIDLLRNPARRNQLADVGAGVVAEHYSFNAFAEEVRRTVERFVPKLAATG